MARHAAFLLQVVCFWIYLGYLPATGQAIEPALAQKILQGLKPRSIGPANMSGRITEVAVYEKRPSIMVIAAASGGVWKTDNNGSTWKPIFEREATSAVGAVAVGQNDPNLIWVGTGEANPRNSVSWGDGVYKSTDGGKTWKHMGLRDTRHIARIVIHPTNPDIVYVAALGRIWGPNKERGLFKTSDGGTTWKKSLFVNQDTGCIDVAMDPEDPNLLYAAMYQVRRDAFSGGNPATQHGPDSGLFRSTNAGATWEKMADGLPARDLGRCGFSIYRKDPNIVFAVVQTDKTISGTPGQPPNEKLDLDAGGIFKSEDKGKTWKHLNSLCPRPFYYGQIRIDPNDVTRLYVLGIAFFVSNDGGKTFLKGNQAPGTHVDYHALWIDPGDSHHLVLGCDGGLNFSYDKGRTWDYLKNLPIAQFYAIGLDMRTPYSIYGGLQDNGTWTGPSASRDGLGISTAEWRQILGFDGYYCQIDPDDPDTVYCEGQYGILRRNNVRTGASEDIKPRLDGKNKKTGKTIASNIRPPLAKDAPEFRYNWSCPILMSPHQPKTIYFGGNHLFRSDDRGEAWAVVSPDLTRGKPGPSKNTGHTITTVAESPLKKGLLYAGTDDGRLHLSQNGGKDWTDLSAKVPLSHAERWITRVECSRFDEGTAYLTIDRHRNDDLAAYVFKTVDFGATWLSIVGNLPTEAPVQVIREDPRNKDLLYLGNELGLFISFDGGKIWHRQPHLPTVPVHDLVVHPRDHELVIATHGRALYIMNVAPLQELKADLLALDAYLCDIKPALARRPMVLHNLGIRQFAGENPPSGAGIYFYLGAVPQAVPTVTIADQNGKTIAEYKGKEDIGLQSFHWKLQQPKTLAGTYRPVPAGTYTATLKIGNKMWTRKLQVDVEE